MNDGQHMPYLFKELHFSLPKTMCIHLNEVHLFTITRCLLIKNPLVYLTKLLEITLSKDIRRNIDQPNQELSSKYFEH